MRARVASAVRSCSCTYGYVFGGVNVIMRFRVARGVDSRTCSTGAPTKAQGRMELGLLRGVSTMRTTRRW